jgi:hypothetical protein
LCALTWAIFNIHLDKPDKKRSYKDERRADRIEIEESMNEK